MLSSLLVKALVLCTGSVMHRCCDALCGKVTENRVYFKLGVLRVAYRVPNSSVVAICQA